MPEPNEIAQLDDPDRTQRVFEGTTLASPLYSLFFRTNSSAYLMPRVTHNLAVEWRSNLGVHGISQGLLSAVKARSKVAERKGHVGSCNV